MKRKELTIGLFGFGCAGYGLYRVLHQTPTLEARIQKICIRQAEKERPIPRHHFTLDPDEILLDPAINVVVELIDDSRAAYDLVSRALLLGKSVVTANKKMLAERLPDLLRIQQETGSALLYEAACCASLPIIRSLEEYYTHDLLHSVEGIVNGSTNFILDQVIGENRPFPEALAQAQERGFAESDPSLDTQGWDAKYKLVILLLHAFGLEAEPEEVFHQGIEEIGEPEIRYARQNNLRIKLIARAFRQANGKIQAFVAPQFVPKDQALAGVSGVFNGIVTRSAFADQQFFVGKGAGAFPTASAVLSDISALTYDYRYEYRKRNPEARLEENGAIDLSVYIRYPKKAFDSVLAHLEETRETLFAEGYVYSTGKIRLSQLQELRLLHPGEICFLLLPEPEARTRGPERKALALAEAEAD